MSDGGNKNMWTIKDIFIVPAFVAQIRGPLISIHYQRNVTTPCLKRHMTFRGVFVCRGGGGVNTQIFVTFILLQ